MVSQVRNLGFVNDLNKLIFASGLIISPVGKSIIKELRYYGIQVVFNPIKKYFERKEILKN
jgi:UDP-N-acetylglucosamine:LPS N-acetylglucosamine transferase